MALAVLSFGRNVAFATKLIQRRINFGVSFVRNEVTTASGMILAEPPKNRFAFLKITTAVLVGMTIGSNAARKGAEFLEATELFVPDEDDD